MAEPRTCPNCYGPLPHPVDECVLGVFIDVLRDRGFWSEDALQTIWAGVDADQLWNRLGPIIDDLGEGKFNE